MVKLRLQFKKSDWPLATAVAALTVFGLIIIYDASVILALRDFGNRYFYVQNQLIWAAVGFLIMGFFTLIDYHRLVKWSPVFLTVAIILLIVVLIPGVGEEVLGAKRRFELGTIFIQPSEFLKFALVIYLGARLSQVAQKSLNFTMFILLLGLLLFLIILEPDLGTAFVIGATAVLVYFVSGAPLRNFLLLGLIFVVGVVGVSLTSPYRVARLATFFNPQTDTQGVSYHVNQILLALGSGGVTGVGLGQSRQKYQYLPEAHTDSIFAVIAEELGFIGASLVIAVFLFVILRGFKIATTAPDSLGQLIAYGVTFWIGLQVLTNLAGQVALLPLTGIPLPFISYGGSSLITTLAGVGVLLNISSQQVVQKPFG